MRMYTVLFTVFLLVALVEFSPALFLAEGSVLMAESEVYRILGIDFFASLFGF